jgi:hypothetical protein
MAYPFQAISKAFTGAYRFLLTALFLLVLTGSLFARQAKYRPAILLIAVWVMGRTMFLAITDSIETRFMAVTVPPMELAVGLGFALLQWSWRQNAPDISTQR